MDCFNHLCQFRQNTTTSYDNCECLACQNRCKGPVTYTASNHTLTADEIAKDELILLPKEEQPSFEEELLKLFGGE